MYAVGRRHPLRQEARAFFLDSLRSATPLVTSAEVLQELMHAYLPVERFETLDAAFALAAARISTVWRVEAEDVRFARVLADRHPQLGAGDLLHLASCQRRGVGSIKTFDRGLKAAFDG